MKPPLTLRAYLREALPPAVFIAALGGVISGVAYAVMHPGAEAATAELRAFDSAYDNLMDTFVFPIYAAASAMLTLPLLRRWMKLVADPPPKLSLPPTELLLPLPPAEADEDPAQATRQRLSNALKKAGFQEVRAGERYKSGNWASGLDLRLEEVRFGQRAYLRLHVLDRQLLSFFSIPNTIIENNLLMLQKAIAKLPPAQQPVSAGESGNAGGRGELAASDPTGATAS